MAKVDIYNRDKHLEKTARAYISRLFPKDRGGVERFIVDLQAQGYSSKRVEKYLAALVSIKKYLEVPFSEATTEDIKRFVAKLERSDYAEWTKHDKKIILRIYMRWLGKAEQVDWMKIKQPRKNSLPEEILNEEEVRAMAGAAYTARDRAFVLALYESGARIGEFLPLKIKHLEFDRYGALVWLSGKTGDRKVRLVASTVAIQAWLREHPDRKDRGEYLWTQVPGPYHPPRKVKGRALSYGFIVGLLRELAQKAGVKKKVSPHCFRHSRATFMARYLKEPEMRQFFGWGKDSQMPAIYVHLSGRDVDNSVLSVYGIKEAENSREPVLKTVPCPRCGEANDPATRYCLKCGLPFEGGEDAGRSRLELITVKLLKVMAKRDPEIKEEFRKIVRQEGAEDIFA